MSRSRFSQAAAPPLVALLRAPGGPSVDRHEQPAQAATAGLPAAGHGRGLEAEAAEAGGQAQIIVWISLSTDL